MCRVGGSRRTCAGARPPGRAALLSMWASLVRRAVHRSPRQPCGVRASPPMEPTVQPNGHVCTTCGAVTGSPNAEPKLSRSRLKLGLASTSLAVGLFCGTPVQCVLVIRESFTREYGSRVFHSGPCRPLFNHFELNQLSLITRTHCIPTDALQRISMTARSSRNCLQATGHAFHWLSWSEQGTRGWPNDSGRLQTGLFGVALPFKLQKKGNPARPPRDALRDEKM